MRTTTGGAAALRPAHTISQAHVQLSAERPVRAQILPAVGEVPPHDHEYHEICLVDGGSAIHLGGAGPERIERGSVLVLAPGGVHAFTGCSALAVTNAYYLAEWLLEDARTLMGQEGVLPLFLANSLFRAQARPAAVWRLDGATASACRRELREIDAEGRRARPSQVLLRAAFVKFLVLLGRSYAQADPERAAAAFRPAIADALDAIEHAAEAGEALRIEPLARAAGLVPDVFTRLFRAQTGWTPMAYFQRRRVHRACSRLLRQDASVTAIALALGYADAAHLSRMFRRVMGTTPRAYRRTYRVREGAAG